MVENGKKAALGLGIAGGIAALIYAATRVKAAPPPEGAAAITIEIIGPEGIPLLHGSPVSVLEGESYTARVTITNLSTKAGQPWEAIFEVAVYADGAVVYFFPTTVTSEYFSAGQTLSFDYPLNVPLGIGGETGSIFGVVRDPAGIELARASEYITIQSVEIIYGATITVGV